MKFNHWAAVAACFAIITVGCNEAPIGDDFADKNYSPQGAVVTPTNVQTGFFDLADPDNAGIAFDLVAKGEPVSSADVFVEVNGQQGTLTNVTSFPATVDVSLDDVMSAVGLSTDDVEIGDQAVFTFESDVSGTVYKSSDVLRAPFSCSSDLAGTLDYTSTAYFCSGDPLTGTVDLEETGAGEYIFSNWAFGTYAECYGGGSSGGGSLTLTDVCNVISATGTDQYGDSWDFIINSVSGATLNATWSNTYGEFGTVELVRQDGNDWPSLSN